ncbi:MAG: type II toxin-antitoxin system VapC family toxin [Anaerolineae bacterium]
MNVYYFDANALYKFYRGQIKGEKGSLNIRRLASTSHPIQISPLTQLEYVSILMKDFRKGYLKKGDLQKLIKRLRRDVSIVGRGTARPFYAVSVPDGTYKQAESILLVHGTKFSIGSNDALHLAFVKKYSASTPITIVTSDQSMIYICKEIDVIHYDPENASP